MRQEPGYFGGPAPAPTLSRANVLVNVRSGAWGTWGVKDTSAMLVSGSGVLFHIDGSSKITPANSAEPGVTYGSRFVQRSNASGWQTVGSWYSQPLLTASTGLQFTHEMDCIPFDDESNPCLANLGRFYWGCWNLNSTALVNFDNPAGLHGVGVTFRVATDTNFYFCADGGSGTLTRVDSGLAPADGTRYIFRVKYNGLVASAAGSCVLEILNVSKTVLATHTFTTNGPANVQKINPTIAWMSDGTSIVRSLSIISQSWAMGLPT